MEVRGHDPLEVWDGAHNVAGMARFVAELPALLEGRHPRVAVFSTLGEKDVAGMVELLSGVSDVVVATVHEPPVLPQPSSQPSRGVSSSPIPAGPASVRSSSRGVAVR